MTEVLEIPRNATQTLPPLETARLRALEPEARERRRETWLWKAERRREDVRRLRERGLVLGAVAETMGVSERTVASIVNELETCGALEARPRYGRGFIVSAESSPRRANR